jgi:4-hydroxy-tetrahydrodipicolinate synthase
MTRSLGSILTAMVTPFREDLSLDLDGLASLADHLLRHGSDGLVVAGTTGESPTLTDDEKMEMCRAVVDVAHGRGTVIAGTGSNDTVHSVELTRRAEEVGVDGVLLVAPYYNKPPRRGLELHFRTVAAATSLPVIIYNIPSRCVVDLPPELLAELATVENIVAVKQADPDVERSRQLRELCDLTLYAGNDDLLLDVLRLGGQGGICVASHIVGEQMQDVVRLVRNGDMAGAEALTARLAPLYEALFATTNPILVKAALDLLGRPVGGLRPPLVSADQAEREALARELQRQGLFLTGGQ